MKMQQTIMPEGTKPFADKLKTLWLKEEEKKCRSMLKSFLRVVAVLFSGRWAGSGFGYLLIEMLLVDYTKKYKATSRSILYPKFEYSCEGSTTYPFHSFFKLATDIDVVLGN